MSRRRQKDMPSEGFRLARRGPDDRSNPVFPADLAATIDLVDPGGHRLVRFGRYFHELDPAGIWWDSNTKGTNVVFSAESDAAGQWTVLWFDCKTCRDQGTDQTSRVSHAAVAAAVTELWDQTAGQGTPRHDTLDTQAL